MESLTQVMETISLSQAVGSGVHSLVYVRESGTAKGKAAFAKQDIPEGIEAML